MISQLPEFNEICRVHGNEGVKQDFTVCPDLIPEI